MFLVIVILFLLVWFNSMLLQNISYITSICALKVVCGCLLLSTIRKWCIILSNFLCTPDKLLKRRFYGTFAEVCTQEFKLQESGTREYITLYSSIQFLRILYKHFAYLGVFYKPCRHIFGLIWLSPLPL